MSTCQYSRSVCTLPSLISKTVEINGTGASLAGGLACPVASRTDGDKLNDRDAGCRVKMLDFKLQVRKRL